MAQLTCSRLRYFSSLWKDSCVEMERILLSVRDSISKMTVRGLQNVTRV